MHGGGETIASRRRKPVEIGRELANLAANRALKHPARPVQARFHDILG